MPKESKKQSEANSKQKPSPDTPQYAHDSSPDNHANLLLQNQPSTGTHIIVTHKKKKNEESLAAPMATTTTTTTGARRAASGDDGDLNDIMGCAEEREATGSEVWMGGEGDARGAKGAAEVAGKGNVPTCVENDEELSVRHPML